jgi:hypothetical protein
VRCRILGASPRDYRRVRLAGAYPDVDEDALADQYGVSEEALNASTPANWMSVPTGLGAGGFGSDALPSGAIEGPKRTASVSGASPSWSDAAIPPFTPLGSSPLAAGFRLVPEGVVTPLGTPGPSTGRTDDASLVPLFAGGSAGLSGTGGGWIRSGIGLSADGSRTLIANPILIKRWESTFSPFTGKGGFTPGLTQLLLGGGIDVADHINPVPLKAQWPTGKKLSPSQRGKANDWNGTLAEEAIADRYKAQGFRVEREVPQHGRARYVDVVVHQPAADPRYSQRLEIESKLGRAGLGTDIRTQVAKDVTALQQNRAIRKGGELLEKGGGTLRILGRTARPIGLVMDAAELNEAYAADGGQIGENTKRALSGIAGGGLGGWGGALGGAAAGAAIGSVVPVVGTAIGGVAGGIIGGLGGGIAGDYLGRTAYDKFRNPVLLGVDHAGTGLIAP